MINNQKYKINTMAKDLNMKSKDLLDLFTKLGMTGRKHSSVVETEEFNVVMEALTSKKQVANFDDYLAGKVTIARKDDASAPKPEPAKQESAGSAQNAPAKQPAKKDAVRPANDRQQPPAPARKPAEMKKPDGTKKPSDNKPAQDAKNDPRGNQASRFGRFEKKPEFSRQKEQKPRDQKKPQPQQEKPAFTIGGKAEKPEKSGSVIVSSGDSRVGKTRTIRTSAPPSAERPTGKSAPRTRSSRWSLKRRASSSLPSPSPTK